METGFFEGVSRAEHKTTAGPCELPILYRDASNVGLFFLVDRDLAERELVDLSIEPWPLGSKALVAFEAWEYRDSTVGAYGEVGLGIQARRRGSKPSLAKLALDMRAQEDQGIWVVTLPVTTQAAYAAGVELWGYPKYVTKIDTDFRKDSTHVRLGKEVDLDVEMGFGIMPAIKMPVVTYTRRGDELIRTVIEVGHKIRFMPNLGGRAGVGAHVSVKIRGDGPTADALRRLGVDRARCVGAFQTNHFRAKLPAGSVISRAFR